MTPFQELDRVVADLAIGAHEALADNFCGAYLQGSFALGYADEYSDVDFLVVTKGELTASEQGALQALHQRLYTMPTTRPRSWRAYDLPRPAHPCHR